jgi:hypothetical protein
MKEKLVALTLSISIALTACAIPPSRQEISTADFGEYPNNYESIVKRFMDTRLKDPESARYQFIGNPQRGWYRYDRKVFGYVICAYINAKNGFGGYTGNQLSYFMIKNGRVIANSNAGSYGDTTERGMCSEVIK